MNRRPEFMSDRCRYCHEFHVRPDVCLAINELEALDTRLLAAEELAKASASLIEAVKNNGHFEDWAPDYDFDVTVDGELDKEVWALAKEALEKWERLKKENQ